MKRALWHIESGDARLAPWEERLEFLEAMDDPIDQLLAEVEANANASPDFFDPSQLELFEGGGDSARHTVRNAEGIVFRGTWREIVRQMRDDAGFQHETLSAYMRRMAERWHEQMGVEIPFNDPELFLRAAVEYRFVILEDRSH